MNKLARKDLMSLEQYATERPAFRAQVLTHKANRKVHLGPNATLYFEDKLTIQYQVQEMLRIERIFEPQGIADELEAYNPLIPDGNNWKATFMLEFPDSEERKEQLSHLVGIERTLWAQVDGFEKVTAITNEDMPRDTSDKTAAVHFARFELTEAMCKAVKEGVAFKLGVAHPNYTYSDGLPEAVRASLAQDLA